MRLCQILFAALLFPGLAIAATSESDFALWEAQQKADRPSGVAVGQLAIRHPDWPGLTALAGKVESNRDFTGLPPEMVIALFKQKTPQSAAGVTAYVNALGGVTSMPGLSELKRIWRAETLDRGAQNDLLQRYGAVLDTADHNARLDRLLDNERVTQAEELAVHLGGTASAYVGARASVIRKEIANLALVQSPWRDRPQIIADFIKLDAGSDRYPEALRLMNRLDPIDPLMAQELWRSRHLVARDFLEKKQYRDAFNTLKNHGLREGADFAAAEFLAGFIALKFLNDPSEAYRRFSNMHGNVTGAVSKSRAAYWAGRAAKALGDTAGASRWYGEAGRYPTTYFGQKAIEASGGDLRSALRRSAGGSGASTLSPQDSRLQGADYFYTRGLPGYARQFLMAAARNAATDADFTQLAKRAQAQSDRAALVKIGREQGKNGFAPDPRSFPKLEPGEIVQARQGGMSNVALVHAIIRQESEFDALARSPAGARGLMQLMPATAQQTAGKAGVAHHADWLTEKPGHNIRLGSAYLSQMLARYNGSHILAVAAYNAGPGRVSQWISRFGDPRGAGIAAEDWIELIPIYETRNYIQRVLEGEAVYAATL